MTWKALTVFIFSLIIFSPFLLSACSSAAAPDPETSTSSSSAQVTENTPSDTTGEADPASETASATTGDAATTSEPASDTTAMAERPPQGGKLVLLYQDPPTLDPHLTTDNISGGLVNEIFGGLVTLDLDLNVVPDLAATSRR